MGFVGRAGCALLGMWVTRCGTVMPMLVRPVSSCGSLDGRCVSSLGDVVPALLAGPRRCVTLLSVRCGLPLPLALGGFVSRCAFRCGFSGSADGGSAYRGEHYRGHCHRSHCRGCGHRRQRSGSLRGWSLLRFLPSLRVGVACLGILLRLVSVARLVSARFCAALLGSASARVRSLLLRVVVAACPLGLGCCAPVPFPDSDPFRLSARRSLRAVCSGQLRGFPLVVYRTLAVCDARRSRDQRGDRCDSDGVHASSRVGGFCSGSLVGLGSAWFGAGAKTATRCGFAHW